MSCFYECFQGKQIQQGFNSLQKLKKSVSGALGAALGSRRFDLEHEPMLPVPEQNWFLTKSAPNSLSNPLLYHQPLRGKLSAEEDIKEEEPASDKVSLDKSNINIKLSEIFRIDKFITLLLNQEEINVWKPSQSSYLSWGGHVMYLPPAPAAPDQPLSMLGPLDRPVR